MWQGSFVEEGSLTRAISTIRATIGDEWIETIPKRGYLFQNGTNTSSPTVAVLPFQMLGNGHDSSHGIGMADSITTRLSNVHDLVVRPTSAVLALRGVTDSARAARELRVGRIVEGRMQQSGDRMQVSVQMIDVAGERAVWAETFLEPNPADAIAERIAEALLTNLNPSQRLALRRHDTENAESYRAYLDGKYFLNRYTRDGLQRAIASFERAVQLDPHYARAYAALADTWTIAADTWEEPAVAHANAATAVAEALRLDPDLGEAVTSRAAQRFWSEWRHDTEPDYRRAIRLAPSYPLAHHAYSWFLIANGRFEEAARELRKTLDLDPLNAPARTDLGMCSYFAGELGDAVAALREAAAREPAFWYPHYWLGRALLMDADAAGAIAAFEYAESLIRGEVPEVTIALATARGDRIAETNFPRIHYELAAAFESAGDRETALHELGLAIDQREKWVSWIGVDPRFREAHDDPRFVDLVRRRGLPLSAPSPATSRDSRRPRRGSLPRGSV